MLFATGTVGKFKVKILAPVEGDFEDAKHIAHMLGANCIDDVRIIDGEIVNGVPQGVERYKVEPDGYGHAVEATK